MHSLPLSLHKWPVLRMAALPKKYSAQSCRRPELGQLGHQSKRSGHRGGREVVQLWDRPAKIPLNTIPRMLGSTASGMSVWSLARVVASVLRQDHPSLYTWLQPSGPASQWNQQGDRPLCFSAVPLRCSWPTQQSSMEGEGRAALVSSPAVTLIQCLVHLALITKKHPQKQQKVQPRGNHCRKSCHSPLLKHISSASAPRVLTQLLHSASAKERKKDPCQFKYAATLIYSQLSTGIHV